MAFNLTFIFLNSEKFKKQYKSRATNSSPERSAVRKPNQSYDLPPVQCKDTLVLGYDHNAQYSKRKLLNNADRYKELSDDDNDENGQMSAADFQQLLSASTSVGDHFTFAAERSWAQNDDLSASDEGSMATELFKLNISNLKDGLGRLPFYLRQGLNEALFTDEEITNMNYSASFFESDHTNVNHRANIVERDQANQNLLNILKSKDEEFDRSSQKSDKNVQQKKTVETTAAVDDELVGLLRITQIQSPQTSSKSIPASTSATATATATMTSSNSTEVKPHSNQSKSKSNKAEDIQDWLDDILNED